MKLAWKLFPLRGDSVKWLPAGELHQTPRVNKSSDQPQWPFEGGWWRQLGASSRRREALSTKGGELIRKALCYVDIIWRLVANMPKKRRCLQSVLTAAIKNAAHKHHRRLENSKMMSVSQCVRHSPQFHLRPGCDTFHQEWSKKSIQVSGDFSVRSNSDSWSQSESVDLRLYPSPTKTDYAFVSFCASQSAVLFVLPSTRCLNNNSNKIS